jgi:hypothetical protein
MAAMMKMCPTCSGTYAGGWFCPRCGVGQPLIDMSSERARPLCEDVDVKRAVQSHYAERAGMVRSALGFLVGVLGGLFIVRFAVGADAGWARFAWAAAAFGWVSLFAGGSIAWARRHAREANDGRPRYVCVDEDAPVEAHRPPPRRGLRWLTW